MKKTLLEEQENRLEMIHAIYKFIDSYPLDLTYPSQVDEFKDDMRDLFKHANSKYNILIKYQKLRTKVSSE